MIRSDNVRRHVNTIQSGSGAYDGHKPSDLSLKQKRSEPTDTNDVSGLRFTTANVVIIPGGQNEAQDWDTESQRSSSRIIKTTQTWAVNTT